jgi:hypothetical protein
MARTAMASTISQEATGRGGAGVRTFASSRVVSDGNKFAVVKLMSGMGRATH